MASRYKASVPIGAYSVKDREGILTSKTIARAIEKIYDDPECPLISRVWLKNLAIVVEYINNSNTDQLGISPVDAIEKEEVLANPSYPQDGPIGFDEEKLSGDDLVRYLLYPSDLEGGRRRAGDLNWSPHIYHIHQSIIQKNQPVLYWLEEVPFGLIDNDDYILKRPERSFIREELMVIPFDTELPS
ncbi:unnamed protein product [Rhizophagus irregularis]|nr:unnamed protein product [Rhizophagus irregularis]